MMAHLMARREPRLSGEPPRAIKWAIIAAPWYYLRLLA